MNSLQQGIAFGQLFSQIEIMCYLMMSKIEGEHEKADDILDLCKRLSNLHKLITETAQLPKGLHRDIRVEQYFNCLTILDNNCNSLMKHIEETTSIRFYS